MTTSEAESTRLRAPASAVYIWTEGDLIYLLIPSPTTDKTHTIRFPNTPTGWIAVNSTLRAREVSEASARTVGNKPAPVQYDIDEMLKTLKKSPNPRIKKAPLDDSITVDDLELDFSDFSK